MKATAVAPSNIAFIKYWGVSNPKLRLPENGSISMNLSHLTTTTTVEFSDQYVKDTVEIGDKSAYGMKRQRVLEHLEKIRKLAQMNQYAKVVSESTFPSATGLSSSASGFAALTVAATKAAGLDLREKDLSILSRLGSGSACRSIPDGFVEWIAGDSNESSYAVSLFPANHWEIVDLVVILNIKKKSVLTTVGHELAVSSSFFLTRLSHIDEKIKAVKFFIQKRKFADFGKLIEREALELHSIMLTSDPPLVYWHPGTISVIRAVHDWRKDGLPVYFTINTGQNVHLICEKGNAVDVKARAEKIIGVKKVIVNRPSEGARLVKKHLF